MISYELDDRRRELDSTGIFIYGGIREISRPDRLRSWFRFLNVGYRREFNQ